jgi:hypothetical protein
LAKTEVPKRTIQTKEFDPQLIAWRISMFFMTGRRSVRFNPALRSRAASAPSAPNSLNSESTMVSIASIGSARLRS